MQRSELLMSSDRRSVRLLLLRAGDQILKGLLPTPASPLAAPRLCESLGLWIGERLPVVLSAADWDGMSAFGLDDGFGAGLVTEHYETVVDLREVRHRGQRLVGLGSFADVRRLRGLR